jgi:hypothetical protein
VFFQKALDNAARNSKNLADVIEVPAFFDHIDDLLNVQSVDLPAVGSETTDTVDRHASAIEGGIDSVRMHTKSLSDILRQNSLAEHPYGSLDVKTQRLVQADVLALGRNQQVLDAIVQLVPVDVVDNLAAIQLTHQSLFNNSAVVKQALSGDLGNSISTAYSPDAIVRSIALAGAEVSAGFVISDLAGPSPNNLSAGTAGDSNLSHVGNKSRHDGIVKKKDWTGSSCRNTLLAKMSGVLPRTATPLLLT